mmetsp:Transcript_115501/g.224687  ORF Transcript_115501/g.224687 Transcript_115501/m.224687 type:complete len:373 (-) Transcript_115501:167-1285(-)
MAPSEAIINGNANGCSNRIDTAVGIPGEEGQLWEVVGGAEKGGILVRKGESLASEAEALRLSTGARVRSTALVNGRLCYKMVSGAGPPTGWVSTHASGKVLLARVEDEGSCSQQPASDTELGAVPRPAQTQSVPSANGRKLRILALHGGGANSEIMKFQTLGLQKIVGDKATWDFLDGGREWRSKTPPSEMMLSLANGKPLRGWYGVSDDGGDERPFAEKLFDESVQFHYEEVDDAVDRVLAHMHEQGPFDVLVGFSQGCIMTHLLAAVLRDRGEPMPWRLSVQFSGMRVRDDRYTRLFKEAMVLPVVQVYGKRDELYAYGRQSQPELYQNPVILEHDEGHKFPSQKPRATEIYERVLKEILWHCADPAQAN